MPVLRGDRRPHLSPFRYPGGKSWLLPVTDAWLRQQKPSALLEPFAGGASVSLSAAANRLVETAHLVELDAGVAAVWRVALTGDVDALTCRILTTALTPEVVRALRDAPTVEDDVDLAFATLVRNRTAHGGSLTDRTGTPNAGERGKGLTQRWYPATLATRLRAVAALSPRLTSAHADGLAALSDAAPGTAAFIDPPYTAGSTVGARLYRHHTLDHDQLFALAAAHPGPVLMTYNDHEAVRALAGRHGLGVTAVAMRGNRGNRRELLIGRADDGIIDALAAAAPSATLF